MCNCGGVSGGGGGDDDDEVHADWNYADDLTDSGCVAEGANDDDDNDDVDELFPCPVSLWHQCPTPPLVL